MVLAGDFQQFFGLDLADVWRDCLTVRRTLVLVERLKYNPDSVYRAMWMGGIQFLGWGSTQYVLANIHDRFTSLTMATAGVEATREHMYPVPTVDVAVVAATIADFNTTQFMKMISEPG